MALTQLQARIARDEYDAFLAIEELRHDLAPRYDEYLERCRMQRLRATANGKTTKEIEVTAQEFIDYCRRTGFVPDMLVFGAYLTYKAQKP